jgi:hypothetical protein
LARTFARRFNSALRSSALIPAQASALADIGVTKKQSAAWQKLLADVLVPIADFEAALIRRMRDNYGELSGAAGEQQ